MKKVLSLLLTAVMLLTMVPATIFAADGITVKIVSFMRGAQTDLRSSELLEVQVEGYDGNPRELTYKWTSSLGTYLYVYNSHNMYGINNTDGEREIYNSAKKINKKYMTGSTSMAGRTYDKTFKEVGFAWASVYGADIEDSQLDGTVKVEVFDKNGKSLGTGTYSNFEDHNLDEDIDNVVIGLFEGDRMDVRDLLGQSGVVHITCTASKVSSATILNGGEYIEVEKVEVDRNTNEYYVKGIKAGTNETSGDAKLNISIKKEYCKFHAYTSGTAEPIVYVFKKPKTSTTTTTLIISKDSVDNRCEYFIDGNKGEKQPDGTIVFTGLTPNTNYTVEVRANYDDNGKTKYVYSYVDDTTKPVYKATVKTYLDGALTDFESIYGSGAELLIRENNPYTEYISLEKTSAGVYEAPLYNGVFNPWCKNGDAYSKIGNHQLVIEHANAEIHLHNYSVKYDTNGGDFKDGEDVGTAIYASGDAVSTTSNIPVREGYIFSGWEYNGKLYGSDSQVTASISAPVVLKAKWEKAVDVTINVTIDHNSNDGGFDQVGTRADLDVDFLEMTENSPAFVETGDKLSFRKDKVTDEKGNKKDYKYTLENNVSTYTATAVTYSGLLKSSAFGVALSKSDYDVEKIEKAVDGNGNWTIDVYLKHAPSNFDIEFSLEMADGIPVELYPDAAIVKVAFWNGSEWEIITQQATKDGTVKPGVRVDIDPVTGEGFGSYPVWKYADNNDPYGYRAVVTGFVYGDSIITVPTESFKGNIAIYTDGNYTATMTDVADGETYGEKLNGAYYDDKKDDQVGTLHGVITVEKYDVTFDANGGTIKGGDTYKETEEYYVPDTKDYVPTFDGHEFGGWYKDPEFKEPAVEGEILKENVTLYAKWDRILTGNVRVAGSYLQDGHIVDVWDVDRAESAVVVLKEIAEDDEYIVDSKTVNIVWPMGEMVYGISEEYRFTGLDPAKEYRAEVLVLNYGTEYQNSTTVYVADDDYSDDYNENDYIAVYPDSSKWETFVNAYLSFEPASYFQPVEVDATLIGETLRPKNTLVEVWYKATGTDNAYQVISQHTVVPYGIEVGMGADGMDDGDYGYNVWNSVYDGNLYDYQAYLSKIEDDKATEWPVSVVYGAPSRYSPLHDAPTGVLQVKIIPNRYGIIYNESYVNEGENVVSYGTHIWSYETVIDYKPEREGYEFKGWYTNPECTGEAVEAIAETVAEDTNLYAKWERTSVPSTPVEPLDGVRYIVEHYKEKKDGSYGIVEADTEILSGKIGQLVAASAKTYDDGYCINEEKSVATASGVLKAISSAEDILTLKLYYDIDVIDGGENGGKGDGTPDKYQKKVIFKVENGTWADGTTADKVVYLDLMKNGKYAVDGTASLTAPTGMKANEGFEGGKWNIVPPATVIGPVAETYIYRFEQELPDYTIEVPDRVTIYEEDSTDITVEIIPGDGVDESELPTVKDYVSTDESVAVVDKNGKVTGIKEGTTTIIITFTDGTQKKVTVVVKEREGMHVVFGKTDGIGWYHVSRDGGKTFETVFGNSTLEVKQGTKLIIEVGDIMGDSFVFYVNGEKHQPDENGQLVVTVNGYMLIGALSVVPEVDFEVPDVEESLNWFQRLIKSIKDFFNSIGDWFGNLFK